MKLSLSKLEMETIFCGNLAEKEMVCYSFDPTLLRRLERLSEERPDEVQKLRDLHDGQSAEYSFPRKWLKIQPPRKLSDSERARLAAQARKINSQRQNLSNTGGGNGEREGGG